VIALLASPVLRYLIIFGGIAAAILAAWVWADTRAYRRGAEAVRSAVEAQDVKAAVAAKKAKDTVDACFDEGYEWDATTGRCLR
jgi:hypothetical protein